MYLNGRDMNIRLTVLRAENSLFWSIQELGFEWFTRNEIFYKLQIIGKI